VDLTKPSAWIKADILIPLPYLGMKYYRYNTVIYANVSALSFSEAKAVTYHAGIDYRIINTLYLGVSYLHEDFKALEREDTVTFSMDGYKVGFKYIF